MLAGTEIRRLLETFRMEWVQLVAAGCPPPASGAAPSPELVAALLAKARDFRVAVEGVIVQETRTPGSPDELRSIRLAPEFRGYAEEDLLVLYSWIVAVTR